MTGRTSNRSLLRIFHKRQNPKPCLLQRAGHRLKSAVMSVLPSSWPVYSPTRSRGTPLKTIVLEMIRRALLQKYLAEFKSRSSSLCPPQTTGNRPYPIPGRRSFPTLRLGSLDCPPQIIRLPPPHVICISRPLRLTLTSSYERVSWLLGLLTLASAYKYFPAVTRLYLRIRTLSLCSFCHTYIL